MQIAELVPTHDYAYLRFCQLG